MCEHLDNVGTRLSQEPPSFPSGTGNEGFRDYGAAGAQNHGRSGGLGSLQGDG